MGPYQRTPKEVARAIRFSGLGVRSVGPVGDVLDIYYILTQSKNNEINSLNSFSPIRYVYTCNPRKCLKVGHWLNQLYQPFPPI